MTTCGTCRYWATNINRRTDKDAEDFSRGNYFSRPPFGACRIGPPTAVSNGDYFAQTHESQSCGRHRRKQSEMPIMPAMTVQTMAATCKPCGHQFQAEVVVNAPVHVFVASANAVRCPKCQAGPNGILLAFSSEATAGRLPDHAATD